MDKRVEATIRIMKSAEPQCASVVGLARIVRLSPWHFTHLFKTETSKTPVQYLKEIRMQRAEELLLNTSLSLKEIVYAVGLSDRSHFSRDFKRLYGLTPKEFMTQKRCYRADPNPPIVRDTNFATEQQ